MSSTASRHLHRSADDQVSFAGPIGQTHARFRQPACRVNAYMPTLVWSHGVHHIIHHLHKTHTSDKTQTTQKIKFHSKNRLSSANLDTITHPDRSFASMWLLQTEYLCHHVVSGRMEQDPARGQTHHHIATHWRQAHRNGIGT